jgi:hypothetical protein
MTTFEIEDQYKLTQLNAEIVSAHHNHYQNSPTGLLKPDESPNGNTMFHLYSDGEITYQKGGWAYGKRNVFPLQPPLSGMINLGFHFPKNHDHIKETYVILTEEECNDFRNKMIILLNKINKK